MLIILDGNRLTELTPFVPDILRVEMVSYWLNKSFAVALPEYYSSTDYYAIELCRKVERQHGKIPLTIPFKLVSVELINIREKAIILTVEEKEFKQRNPGLCRATHSYSPTPRSSRNGLKNNGNLIGDRSKKRSSTSLEIPIFTIHPGLD